MSLMCLQARRVACCIFVLIALVSFSYASTEFSVAPGRVASPVNMIVGPDGNLWFAELNALKIGKITTGGVITEYPIPAASALIGIAKGPDGNIWFTDELAGTISRISTSGTNLTKFALPTGSHPQGIIAGPDNNLWFVDQKTNAKFTIGKITTSGVITEYASGSNFSGFVFSISPAQIVAGPDGNLWFINPAAGLMVGKVTTSGTSTIYSLQDQPLGITSGPDGNLWIAESQNVASVTPAGVETPYYLPVYGISGAYNGIAVGPDGNIWFSTPDNLLASISTTGVVSPPSPPLTGVVTITNVTSAPDGNLWILGQQSSSVGRVNTAGTLLSTYNLNNGSQPVDIAAGPDGALWFTAFATNQIGKISTSGAITTYPTPTLNAGPNSIVAGPDGNMWFTEINVGQLAKISTVGVITEYPLGAQYVLADLAAGPDGNLWIVDVNGSILKVTTVGNLTEYPLPSKATFPAPTFICSGPDGNLWFTERVASQVGKITTAGVITEYPLTPGRNPGGIVAGQDGNLWFLEYAAKKPGIGKMSTAGSLMAEYPVPLLFGTGQGIKLGPDGAVWFPEDYPNTVARVTTKGAVSSVSLSSPNACGSDLAVGSDSKLWVAEQCSGSIGRLSAIAGTGSTLSVEGGTSFTAALATFTDSTPTATSNNFKAIIDWGDGSTSSGTVSGPTGGPFSVSGTHLYSDANKYSAVVTLTDSVDKSTYKASVSNINSEPAAATMISPLPGSVLPSSAQMFTWTKGAGVSQYTLNIGTSPGAADVYSVVTTALQASVTNLPLDGVPLYVTLGSMINGVSYQNSYTYTAAGTPTGATITSPASGTTLTSPSVTFKWSSASGATAYNLTLGSTSGAHDIANVNAGTATSAIVNSIPTDGRKIYAKLATTIGGTSYVNSYTYIAAGVGTPAQITSPLPGTLTSNNATFSWNTGKGISSYQLWIGTSAGAHDIDDFSGLGVARSKFVGNLPMNGGSLYVTLWSLNGNTWLKNSYRYIASGTGTAAAMVSPIPGGTLTSSSQAFYWSKGSGISQYTLTIGTSAGGADIATINAGTSTSTAVSSLPVDGSKLYVTLGSLNGNTTLSRSYTYISSGGGSNLSLSHPSPTVLLGESQQFTCSIACTNWAVNGVIGGNANIGTITTSGLYTAPSILPNTHTVNISAANTAKMSDVASAAVTVLSDVALTIATSPTGAVSVPLGSTLQFVSQISSTGAPSQAVTWKVNGIAAGNSNVGTISASGLYTAPVVLPSAATVKISGTSVADSSQVVTLSVTIAGTRSSVSKAITASIGGTLTLPDGSSVVIPPGALASDQTVTLSEVTILPHQPANGAVVSVGNGLVLQLSNPNPTAFRSSAMGAASSISAANLLFTIKDPSALSSSLTGSEALFDAVDSSNNDSFLGAAGSYDGAEARISVPASALNGTSTLACSQANTTPLPPPPTGPRSLVNGRWTSAFRCPAPGAKTLVLIHGMMSQVEKAFPDSTSTTNPGCASSIKTTGGYDSVVGFDYDWLQDIDTSGGQLADFLDLLQSQCGVDQIDIEAHSEGVPVSISAGAQVNGATADAIQNFVSLGGPILGTPVADDAKNLVTAVSNLPTDYLKGNLKEIVDGQFVTGLRVNNPDLASNREQFASNAPNVHFIEAAGNSGFLPVLDRIETALVFGGAANDGIIPVSSALPYGSGLPNESQLPVFGTSHIGLECSSDVQNAVGAQLALAYSPTSLVFDVPTDGSSPADQILSLKGANSTPWTASVTNGSTWLSIAPNSGSTPSQITASVDTSGLTPGTTYKDSITLKAKLSATKSVTATVPVTLNPLETLEFSGILDGTIQHTVPGDTTCNGYTGSAKITGTFSLTLTPDTTEPGSKYGITGYWAMSQGDGICENYSATFKLLGYVDDNDNVFFGYLDPMGWPQLGGTGVMNKGEITGTWGFDAGIDPDIDYCCSDHVFDSSSSFTANVIPTTLQLLRTPQFSRAPVVRKKEDQSRQDR